MRYLLSKEFTKINETKGTIQNSSRICTLEMSSSPEMNKGLLIKPLQKHTFSNTTIYLRCIDGAAEACVEPFIIDSGDSSGTSNDTSSDQDFNVDDIWNDSNGDSSSTNFDADVNDIWGNI